MTDKRSQDVDAFIENQSPEWQAVLSALRALVFDAERNLEEASKWNSPTYSLNENICNCMMHTDHVNLQFFNGAKLNDPKGLLEGTGKSMRHVKIHSLDDVKNNYGALVALVRTAAELNTSK
ncbi:MAG: hypothetical protein MAGBODY4_01359 [Candidatus Marinimicrobia bacterium]|nr:hypothetical protein [Candidatus Neomarinimicrobiota bacterium]